MFIAFALPIMVFAQTVSLETFEDETSGTVSFTDNGQVFNITSQIGTFNIYKGTEGFGWNGTAADNAFIDNSDATSPGQNVEFTIATNGEVPFTLKSMWLYFTNSDLTPGSGTITITGKRLGSVVYTATASLSSPDPDVDNGYVKFDMTNYGGADNSNVAIDAFAISTTGDFEYVGMDAMSWTTVNIATPVTISGFGGYLKNGAAFISWKSGVESGFDHFELEKSIGGNAYSLVRTVEAKGNNSEYELSLPQSEKTADYRLKMVDVNNKISIGPSITISGSLSANISIYPNPASNYIYISVPEKLKASIYDATGRRVQVLTLNTGLNQIDVTTFAKGLYFVKAGEKSSSFVKK